MNMQKGFTLIELVVVIVILGILAAVAVPRFVDLSEEAAAAGLKGVAGGIESASAINYAAEVAGDTAASVTTAGQTCDAAADAILSSPVDAAYIVDAGTSISATPGTATDCTITYDSDGDGTVDVGEPTATASIISVP